MAAVCHQRANPIALGWLPVQDGAGCHQTARGASAGIDGLTVQQMVKDATAGNLLADSIQMALEWGDDFE